MDRSRLTNGGKYDTMKKIIMKNMNIMGEQSCQMAICG